ncbi:MAG: rRNA maturation RNase YbeY [Muribaculum sp.]|nr:rRNA maturation RNase YbeY [Muribaculaceae bacterium]MCM1081320.1 rRNA maturation RNase YbeY [Muribaculum sp.]
MPQLDFDLIQRWIESVGAKFGRKIGHLAYIFCNDDRILEVNREFLQHDYYTDIITFDNSRGKYLSGDMFISLDTVASNANLVGSSYMQELHRVIIHGVLHLCGINDKGPGEREIMEANEDAALSLLTELKNTTN